MLSEIATEGRVTLSGHIDLPTSLQSWICCDGMRPLRVGSTGVISGAVVVSVTSHLLFHLVAQLTKTAFEALDKYFIEMYGSHRSLGGTPNLAKYRKSSRQCTVYKILGGASFASVVIAKTYFINTSSFNARSLVVVVLTAFCLCGVDDGPSNGGRDAKSMKVVF